MAVTCSEEMAVWPWVTVAESEPPVAAATEKSIPAPERLTSSPPTLSCALSAAVTEASKTTLIVQEPPPCRVRPAQLSPSEKSTAFVPETVIAGTVTGEVPELATVTCCDALSSVPNGSAANVKEFVESVKAPLRPERLTVWVPAVSVIVRRAISVPVVEGVNLTLIAQEPPPAARGWLWQLSVSEESEVFAAEMATL